MMLIFDLETDGLYHDVTDIHCLVIYNTESNETLVCNSQGNKEPIVRGVTYLEDAAGIVGHNIINYDIPVIRKLYPWFNPSGIVIDTLVLSRIYHADMMKLDKKHNWKTMPLQMYGRHSLESYGHRLGDYKGDFGKDADWSQWSKAMEEYCIQDVNVTTKLWKHFQPYLNSSN